jgi:hypothetical protein
MPVPRDPNTYANYLRTLIRRYGPRGTFWAENPGLTPRPIRQWQIWNEPNVDYFWGGDDKTWAESFVKLLKVAHDVIKQEDPEAKVVLPGLSDYGPWDAASALNRIYNNGVYSRNTMRGLFDFAGLHPYVLAPKDVVRMATRFRDVMNKNGDTHKPQMITEMSWPSSRLPGGHDRAVNSGGIDVTEQDQANNIAAVYPLLARAREPLRLANVTWYSWNTPNVSRYSFSYSGLRTNDRRGSHAKPSYAAWAKVVRNLEGCRNVTKRSVKRCG